MSYQADLEQAVATLKLRKATVVFIGAGVTVIYPGQRRSATADTLVEAVQLAEERME